MLEKIIAWELTGVRSNWVEFDLARIQELTVMEFYRVVYIGWVYKMYRAKSNSACKNKYISIKYYT